MPKNAILRNHGLPGTSNINVEGPGPHGDAHSVPRADKFRPMDDLRSWVDEWMYHLRAGDLSPLTLRAYQQGIDSLLNYLAVLDPVPATPETISRKILEGWALSLAEAGYAPATRQLRIIAVTMWFGYMVKADDCPLTVNHAADLPFPVSMVKPVPMIDHATTRSLLATCTGPDYAPRRDNLIIRLLYDTGARASEIAGIRLDDIDERHQQILVHGKGRKDRIVVYDQRTALSLSKFRRVRAKHQASSSSFLLLATRRNYRAADWELSWRISGAALRCILYRRSDEAEVPRINPHRFRNTWASELLDAGVSPLDVERLAGWTSPGMVRRYTLATADERARAASRRVARGDRV